MNEKIFFSPVAIDLGAKNTGVYMPQYLQGSKIKDIAKSDKRGYTLSHNQLTLMMVGRTSKRHQRRGYDRKQMAKRLARLVLINGFGFNFDKHQEAISFLINRRGRILGDDTDDKALLAVPEELCKIAIKHSKVIKKVFTGEANSKDGSINLTDSIIELMENIYNSEEGYKEVKNICDVLSEYVDSNTLKNSIKKTIKNARTPEEKAKSNKELKEVEALIASYESISPNIFAFKKSGYAEDEHPSMPDEQSADNAKSYNKDKEKYYAYIVWNILTILQDTLTNKETGHALRGVYFKHLKQDLDTIKSTDSSNSSEPIDRRLSELVKEISQCTKLASKSDARINAFINLIGNISNIQLRGLRKYFNDTAHTQGDQWQPQQLDKIYNLWLSSLRPSKGKQAQDVEGLQKEMSATDKIADSVAVNLWIKTSPIQTIPPFENQNNRRPPECRSLLLKPYKLDQEFADWRNVVETIIAFYKKEHPDIYKRWEGTVQNELIKFGEQKIKYAKLLNKMQRSSKAKPEKQSQLLEQNCWAIKNKQDAFYARALQFFLDLSKSHQDNVLVLRTMTDNDDGLNKFANGLGKEIRKKNDKKSLDDFRSICKQYYTEIAWSMDGRWFQDNHNNLLEVCNEKTRNKKYQVATDFGALFGLNTDEVNKLTSGIGVENWLINNVKGLKTHADRCSKLQKNIGTDLEKSISIAKGKIQGQYNKPKLEDYEKDLIKIDAASDKHAMAISDAIHTSLGVDLPHTKFNSVFTFAQIDNIVFGDRSGNAKNCPCCSIDNQSRMQRLDVETGALASRLRGYIARPIDGVMRKLLNAKALQVAELKVQQIIDSGYTDIVIPIITEQNRFSFEEELGRHKNKINSKKLRGLKKPDQEFLSKEERIKQAGNNVCPYTGVNLASGNGEIDHIVSRSKSQKSMKTIINSEANLIYVASRANREKGKDVYGLIDLHNTYLKKQFGTTDLGIIKRQIEEALGTSNHNGSSSISPEDIKKIKSTIPVFKNFSNFLRLRPEEQKAFRHALFLPSGNLARRLVENSLKTSTKAKVNGSQRYFADLVAKHISENRKLQKTSISIRYDYFEVPAEDISALRKHDLSKIEPSTMKSAKQSFYSHTIDAMLAFLAANELPVVLRGDKEHNRLGLVNNDGGLLFNIDKKTGELTDTKNYEAIKVGETTGKYKYQKIEISRRKPGNNYYLHRDMHSSGSFYAINYLPLLICKDEPTIRVGFSPDNSVPVKAKEQLPLLKIFGRFADDKEGNPLQTILKNASIKDINSDNYQAFIDSCQDYIMHNTKSFLYFSIKSNKANEFLVSNINTKLKDVNEETITTTKKLYELIYQTKKSDVSQELQSLLVDKEVGKKAKLPSNKDKESIKNKLFKKLVLTYSGGKIKLPIHQTWEQLINELYDRNKTDNAYNITAQNVKKEFLREHAAFNGTANAKKSVKRLHKKVKTAYSLPLKNELGVFLQQRNSWNGNKIYQALNSSDPRLGGNLYQSPLLSNNKIEGVIQSPYVSSKAVYLKGLESSPINGGQAIDPRKWYKIDKIPQDLKNMQISKLSYRLDDATSATVRFEIPAITSWEQINNLESSPYLKPRENSLGKAGKLYDKLLDTIAKEDNNSGKSNKQPTEKGVKQAAMEDFKKNNCTASSTGLVVEWKAKGAGYNVELMKILQPAIEKVRTD